MERFDYERVAFDVTKLPCKWPADSGYCTRSVRESSAKHCEIVWKGSEVGKLSGEIIRLMGVQNLSITFKECWWRSATNPSAHRNPPMITFPIERSL